MDKSSKIKVLLKQVTGTDRRVFDFLYMTFLSIEGDTCTAMLDGFEIPGIRLACIPGGASNGILITPAKDSTILVADLSCGEMRNMAVVGYSEIESVKIHKDNTTIIADSDHVNIEVGGSSLQIEDNGIKINGGHNYGMAKIMDLVSRFNQIENNVNNLRDLLTAWQPMGDLQDTTKLKTAILSWLSDRLETTRQEHIENDKVTH